MKKINFLILIAFLNLTSICHAVASGNTLLVEGTPVKSAQQVVKAQLKAFAADDAKLAFSFASPEIQSIFGTAEQFLEMVKVNYPVVHRPVTVVFLKPKQSAGVITQPVRMSDTQGTEWIAIYRLEIKNKNLWRIAGCAIKPVEDPIPIDVLKSI